MSDIIELDINDSMTPEQVLGRVSRQHFDNVLVIGRESNTIHIFQSNMSPQQCHWMISKAGLAYLGTS